MKNILTLIVIASILMACKKDKEIIDSPTPPIKNNLVCNPSFEINGQGSLNCWNVVKDFTTYPDTFSTVVPTNGGQFSLRINGINDVNWDPYAETYITNISGQKVISLSAHVMSIYGGQPIYLTLDHIQQTRIVRASGNKTV